MAWVDNNDYPPLAKDWAGQQEKVFTRWFNTQLKRREPPIELKMGSLYAGALCSGVILWELIDQIAGDKPTKKVDRRGKMRIHYINNINLTIDFLTKGNLPDRKPLKFVNVGAEDICDKKKVVAGFVWTIILRFQVADCSIDLFIAWLNSIGIAVRNLTSDWQNGVMLHKLVNLLRPGYLQDKGNAMANVEHALQVAEEEFAIPRIVDAEDMVQRPDERSNFVYLSYYKQMWDELNSSSCLLVGEPKHTVRARTSCNFEIETWDVANIERDVVAVFTSSTGETFPVQVQRVTDKPVSTEGRSGHARLTFVPPRAGIYTSSIRVGGKEMRKGPIIVTATPAPSAKIVSVPEGKEGVPTIVQLTTENGLKGDDLFVELVDVYGRTVAPASVKFQDDGNNRLKCTIVPPSSGQMTLRIKYKEDGTEVEGSGTPFTVFGKPSVNWDSADVPDHFYARVKNSVVLHAVGHDADNLDITLRDPDGHQVPVSVVEGDKGTFVVQFTPDIRGLHHFDIKADHVSVQGLPRDISVEARPDASFLGPRELFGVAMKPVKFKLNTVNLKPGDVKLDISTGKGQKINLPVSVDDNGDGTFTVAFTPNDVGNLEVQVHVSGADLGNLSVHIAPPPTIVGDLQRTARATKPFEFQLQATNIDAEDIRVNVENEKGNRLPPAVVREGKPNFTVSFVPPDPGTLKVNVWPCYDGAKPLSVKVLPIAKFIGETDHQVVATKPFSFKVQGAEGISLGDIAVAVTDSSGKKIADATVSDNRDGTYTATFTPQVPGALDIRISTCGDVLDTPLRLQVLPSLSLDGENKIKKAAAARPFSFDLQGQKGLKPKHVTLNVNSEKGSKIAPPVVKENPDGSFKVTFVPPKPDMLDVEVFAHGVLATRFPVEVVPTCHFDDDDLSRLKGYASLPVEFKLKADAGLKPSDVSIDARDKDGLQVPWSVSDCGGGKFQASFTPQQSGDHVILVSSHGVPISAPLTAEIHPLAQLSDSLTSRRHTAYAHKPFTFDLETKGVDKKHISVEVKTASGKPLSIPVSLEKGPKDTTKATFVPDRPGELRVALSTGGVPFPKELTLDVNPTARFEGDSHRKTTATKPFSFTLLAPELSVDDVVVTIEGKVGGGLPPPKITDNRNGTFNVAFVPMEGDDLSIAITTKGVKFDTPLEVVVAPIASFTGDTKRVASAMKPFDFNLSAKQGLKPKDIHIDIVDSNGNKLPSPAITDSGDGTFKVSFTPKEPGDLQVHVSTNGVRNDTPLEVHVKSSAKVLGGRRPATATKPYDFGLGADGLKVGDVKVTMTNTTTGKQLPPPTVSDQGDGTFLVAFTPEDPGLLKIEVKAHGENVVSPIDLEVAPIARFLGDLDRTGHSKLPFTFLLDAPRLKPEDVVVSITNDKDYELPLPTISSNEDGTLRVTFVPVEPGKLEVNVSTKGETFDTPLKVQVLPTAKWDIPADFSARATVPVSIVLQAEEGLVSEDLTIDICYEDGDEVPHELKDNGDGTFTLSFLPLEEGDLTISLSAHGDPVSDSKIKVAAPPSATLPDGPPLRDGIRNEPFTFTVEGVSLRPNDLKIMMGDEEAEYQVKDMSDGTFDISLLPTKVGDFPVRVLFNGKPAGGKPFAMKVAAQPNVNGFGALVGARVAKPFTITLNTVNVKPDNLDVQLKDSEGLPITNFQVTAKKEDKIEITFTPKVPGDHYFNVGVAGHSCPGLPTTFPVAPKPSMTLVGDKKRKGMEGKLFEFKIDAVNLRPEDVRIEVTDGKGEKIWREDALAKTPTLKTTPSDRLSTTTTTSGHGTHGRSSRSSIHAGGTHGRSSRSSMHGGTQGRKSKPRKGKEEDSSISITMSGNISNDNLVRQAVAVDTPALKGIMVPGDVVFAPPDVTKKGDTLKFAFTPWKPGKFNVLVTVEDVAVDLLVTADPKGKTHMVDILEQLGLNAAFKNIGDEKELMKLIKEKREELISGYTRNSQLTDTYKERERTISLLVRNQTSIVAINRAKKKGQRGNARAVDSSLATFQRNRKQMALYSNLFYLLRTEPQYLAKLVTLANSKELASHIIRTLFSNAYTPIQQTMLLKLIATSLTFHVQTTTSFEDYKKESASVDLFLLFVKETKEGREFMKTHFQNPVMELVEQPLFTIDNAEEFLSCTQTFYDTIIDSVDDLPYGIRYVCKIIYNSLEQRYPEMDQSVLLSAVGWVISYRFINLVKIADWGLVDPTLLHDGVVNNTASIMKVLNSLFLDLKELPSNNSYSKVFNKWIKSQLPSVKVFLKAVIDVPNPEEHYKVSNYSYLGEGESISIPVKEIIMVHNECEIHRNELVNKDDPNRDPLYVLLEELKEVPTEGAKDKTQVSLPLQANSKFEIQLSAVERVTNIKLETINALLYLFTEYPNINGETLLEMFLLIKHKATTGPTPKPKDAAKVDSMLRNLAELSKEKDSPLTKVNGYNDFIADVKAELVAKEKHLNDLRYELAQLSDAIIELDEQKRGLADGIKTYEDYLKSIADDLQRNFVSRTKKFSWRQLTDKKCNIIAGTSLNPSQMKAVKFEITHVAAEEFRVKGKVLHISTEFNIKMSDLLDAKDNGETTLDTGQQVVLDVAATLVFLNSKFLNKKRKVVRAK